MRKMFYNIGALLNIRPGEGRAAVLMLIHSFFTGVAGVYLGTASYTLFLTKFEAKLLPYVYICSAGVVTLVGLLYAKFQERISFSSLLVSTLSVLFAGIFLLYGAITLFDSRWIVMAVPVFYNILLVLTGLEFWGLAGYLFNVRQGKRLFGLIGSGGVIAAIIGGLSVSVIVHRIGTVNLMAISGSGMFVSLLFLIAVMRRFGERTEEPGGESDTPKTRSTMEILRDRYCTLIFALAAISIFGYYLIDYVFYDRIESEFSSEAELASFIGVFYAGFRILTLISSTFVYSSLISRFGLGIGLLTVPGLIFAGSAAAVAAFHIPDDIVYFFWIVVVIKFLDNVCRLSIEEPSFRILYQPIPEARRLKTQTLLETIVEPLSSALAGSVLLLLTSVLTLQAIHLFYLTLLILGFWITVAVLLRREYTYVLTNALAERKLKGVSLSLDDGSSRSVLREGLKSSNAGEVIYCMNMLEEIEHEALDRFMIELIDHPQPDVRLHVLARIGELGVAAAAKPVEKRLAEEAEPAVIGAILRTLCSLSETDAFETVFPYLDSPDLDIRKGAMAGLLRNGGIDGVLSAGARLNEFLDSSDPVKRHFAAQILGEVGISGFYRPLINLLKDDDPDVQRAAIIASGKLKNKKLFPLLLEKYTIPKISNTAVAAVAAFGETVLKDLESELDRDDLTRPVRLRIIRTMEKIGGEKMVQALKKRIDFSEEDIRNHILFALVLCKHQFPPAEIPVVNERIFNEIIDATWTLTVMVDIGDTEHTRLVYGALASEINKNRRRIFMLLAMIYERQSILNVEKNLASTSVERRANALEALDNILSTDIKPPIMALLEDIPETRRHSRLADQFPQKRMGRHERLKEILARSRQWTTSWTRACALFTVGKIATMEFYDSVVASLSDSDSIVRETAIWALGCINPDDLVERLQPMLHDKSRRVADYARFVINTVGFCNIPAATGYLTKSGKYAVDLFMNILEDEGERRVRRRRAAGILSRFGNSAARQALVRGLAVPDKTVRSAILDSLVKGTYIINDPEKSELLKVLRVEIEDAKHIIFSMIALMPREHSQQLVRALNEEIKRNRKRVLSILILLSGDKEALSTIFYWYFHQDQRTAPSEIDERLRKLISVIADDALRRKVYTLFRVRDYTKVKIPREVFQRNGDPEKAIEVLGDIAFNQSTFTLSWSRICAVEMIVKLDIQEYIPRIVECLKDSQDVIRATAAWALYKLQKETFDKYVSKLRNDPSALVSKTAEQLERERINRIGIEETAMQSNRLKTV